MSAVLGMPLEYGYENFHWIAPTTAVQIPQFPDAVPKAGTDLGGTAQARKRGKRETKGPDPPKESETRNGKDTTIPDTNRSTFLPWIPTTAGFPSHSSQQCPAGTGEYGDSGGKLARRGTQGRLVSPVGNSCNEGTTRRRNATGKGGGVEALDDARSTESSGNFIDIYGSEGPRRRSKRFAKRKADDA